jgi:hypothetical protein
MANRERRFLSKKICNPGKSHLLFSDLALASANPVAAADMKSPVKT